MNASEMLDDWSEDRDRTADWQAEILADHPPEIDVTDDTTPWTIDDDHQAEWALRKIRTATRELERLESVAAQAVADVKAWQDEASSPLAGTIKFFEAKLVDYRRRLEEMDPELAKTYKLPTGDLIRRAGRARTTVLDDEAFCAWALENERSAVSVKPLVSALSKSDRFRVAESGDVVDKWTGEIVPAVQVRSGSDWYGVKVR